MQFVFIEENWCFTRIRAIRMKLIVCKNYKFAYCPIPKNACTTLKYWVMLLQETPPDDPQKVHIDGIVPQIEFEQSNTYSEYGGYVTFAIIRDPYERLISAFLDKFVKKRNENVEQWKNGYWGHIAYDINVTGEVCFLDFIKYVEPDSGKLWKDDQHWGSQYTRCKNFKFDIYLEFERLQQGINKIAQVCNIPTMYRELPSLNRGLGKSLSNPHHYDMLYDVPISKLAQCEYLPKQAFYASELVELVKIKYARDYHLHSQCINAQFYRRSLL